MLWQAFVAVAYGRVAQKDTPFTAEDYWTLWDHFKSLEGTANYANFAEHSAKFDVFKANMDFAREFNQKGEYSFTLGVTRFADMTKAEFEKFLEDSSKTKPAKTGTRTLFDASKFDDVADSVDWVGKGAVTPIKNQGQCGSCWAFSTTGGIEGQYEIKHGTLASFSEQQLVDCSTAQGNQGCNGGLMDQGFEYVRQNGLCFESAYPYEGSDGTCRSSQCTSKVTLTGHTDIAAGSTSDLKSAVSNVGPISIAVDANFFWQMYTGGIFDHTCNPSQLDHGVLAVGYGTGYWKVKNSWGAGWGESGYIRLEGTTQNTCGLANSASYPLIS